MIQEISFGTVKNTDLNFYVASVKHTPPKVKTRTVDIPYTDGSLDLTDYYGTVNYGNRKIEITGLIIKNVNQNYNNIVNTLHGKQFASISIDGITYSGRVEVGSMTTSKAGTFVITCDCIPTAVVEGA